MSTARRRHSVPKPTLSSVRRAIRQQADQDRAKGLQRFFRTAPGEYGAGDRFLGLSVPQVRALVPQYRLLALENVTMLLRSPWHEERLLALLILVHRFGVATPPEQRRLFRLYLRERRPINNWDLVDLSAPHIVGAYLHEHEGPELERLARSASLWDRRMAMVATQYDIRRGRFDRALRVAEILVDDGHDLIHKAVGWMLREIGNRDPAAEERFLRRHAATMPRTMLRYAIEKFPEPLRRVYLSAGGTMRPR